ncbi:MAG: hypothetical protein QOJ62_107 [Actinomycetota bacterium]|nr:hypothetical protein [Actinomycetota bacterium]
MRTHQYGQKRGLHRFAAGLSLSALACATLITALPAPASAVGVPTVTVVSPNRGPETGLTSITVTGTNFTGVTSVMFGGVAGTGLAVGSATSLTVTAPPHLSASVDVTVVASGGTSLASAGDIYTYLKVLFTDTFTNNTTAEPMYLPAGTGAANVACLTAGSVTTQTPLPDCAASGGDINGQGVLRLTTNVTSQEGAAFYATSLPTASGLDLTFNTYQYGTAAASAADGIAFALGATDPANPGAPVNMGPAGGHLGYSGGSASPAGAGLAHGYMGFGLDVYGNFTNATYSGSGCTAPSWLTAGQHAQNITIRGPGNGTVGYCVLDSTLNPAHGAGLGTKRLDNPAGTDATRSVSLVPVEVALNPSTAPVITTSGITIPPASWAMRATPLTGTAQLITGALPNIASGLYPSSWIDQATGMPYMLTFGWVASTGGSTDVHAVSNVTATTLQPLSATVFTLTNTDSGSSALAGGSSYTSTLTATLDPSSITETHPITVSGTYPSALVPTTISAGAGWTNCLVTGQTFSCTYPASAGSPVTAGTVLPTIQVGFAVKSGASQTTNATVVQGQVTSPDALPAAGNDYTTVSYGTATASSMTPVQGSTSGGTEVIITGANMYGVTGVTFDGVAALSFSHDSNTQITAYSPSHVAASNKTVVLTYGTSGTVSPPQTFTWNASAPTITSISPGSGPVAGGTVVTITGAGFVVGTTTVSFGGTAASSVLVNSTTSITATTPAGTVGRVTVDATTSNGTASTAAGAGFLYYAVPAISGLTPVEGPTAGFTTVNVSGTGFLSVTGVDFGGTAASSYTINSDLSITASSPAHSVGATTVHLSYGGGTVSAGTFTYVGPPTFTVMTPTSGPTAGGTTVTVTGTNLQNASITVGGVAATNVIVAAGGTSLTFVTPAAPAGAAAVVIGAIGGSVPAGNYTYAAPPTISGLAPTSGPEAGGTSVVITGTGFTSASAVSFGSTAATSFTVNTDTQITANSPAGVGVVAVNVTTPGGTAVAPAAFTYLPAPTVTGLAPTTGPATGGTSVVITGTGFTGATAVTFGGVAATGVIVNSATQITATTPAGTGAVTVSVTTPNGTGTSAGTFGYIPAPAITSFTPTFGPEAGGTTVVITGTAFTGATAVTFGATNAPTYTVNSDTQITVTSPAGTGAVNLSVTTGNGTAISFGTFTYLPAPTITSFTPTFGPAGGGTSVVITGTGFSGATLVAFGGVAATGVVVNSATQITAVTPAGSGTVTASVTTPNGTGISVGTFDYVPAPTITSFTPTSGPAIGGTSVVITGTAFTTTTAVAFGGTPATSYIVDSDTQITAFSPAGAGAVTINVVSVGGAGVSLGTFNYVSSGGGGGGGFGLAVTRIGGPDRDATANLISQAMYPTPHSARVVILAGDHVFADALAGSPMSKVYDGPVLLTPSSALSSSAQDGIVRVLDPGGTVYILGGPAAISESVVAHVNQLGYVTVRIGGADRYATAALIATNLSTSETIAKVYLATGISFPDALAAASAAGSSNGVILLTAGGVMPAATSNWLAAHLDIPRLAIGSQAALAAPSATVLAGPDRYGTSIAVAAASYPNPTGLLLAAGVDFPDALAGAAYAAQKGWGLLLVNPQATSVSSAQTDYLTRAAASVTTVVILGGTDAMPQAAADLIVGVLNAG